MKLTQPVTDIMTRKVVSVLPDTPVEDIKGLMEKREFHHLPVVNSDGFLLGIISTEDFNRIEKIMPPIRNNAQPPLTARKIMTKYPIFLSPDDTIGLALEIFLENRFHALPIVEDGTLVGILTTHDALAYTLDHEVIGG